MYPSLFAVVMDFESSSTVRKTNYEISYNFGKIQVIGSAKYELQMCFENSFSSVGSPPVGDKRFPLYI